MGLAKHTFFKKLTSGKSSFKRAKSQQLQPNYEWQLKKGTQPSGEPPNRVQRVYLARGNRNSLQGPTAS